MLSILSRKCLTVCKTLTFPLIVISSSFLGKSKFGTCKLLSTPEPQQARCVCAHWWYVICWSGECFPVSAAGHLPIDLPEPFTGKLLHLTAFLLRMDSSISLVKTRNYFTFMLLWTLSSGVLTQLKIWKQASSFVDGLVSSWSVKYFLSAGLGDFLIWVSVAGLCFTAQHVLYVMVNFPLNLYSKHYCWHTGILVFIC